MFDRFTPRAHAVLAIARHEASLHQNQHLGTEHILVGLLANKQDTACQIIQILEIKLDDLKTEAEKLLSDDPTAEEVGTCPFTTHAEQVLQIAVEEAERVKLDYVGTEHLLLGLLDERQGSTAARMLLLNFKVDAVRVRACVTSMLDRQAQEQVPVQSQTTLRPVVRPDTQKERRPNTNGNYLSPIKYNPGKIFIENLIEAIPSLLLLSGICIVLVTVLRGKKWNFEKELLITLFMVGLTFMGAGILLNLKYSRRRKKLKKKP